MSLSDMLGAPGANWLSGARSNWPGILLAIVVAIAATFIADTRGGPAMLYALLLGMALHPVSVEGSARLGIDFSAKRILRLGVALLGARITLEELGGLGWFNGALIVAGVLATIGFGMLVSRMLGLDRQLGILTGGATAICGASAVCAIAGAASRIPREVVIIMRFIFGTSFFMSGAEPCQHDRRTAASPEGSIPSHT